MCRWRRRSGGTDSQIEYFIQKKMDVIIIIPIDGDALYDVVKEAKSKGICVICYDRIIPNVNAGSVYYDRQ